MMHLTNRLVFLTLPAILYLAFHCALPHALIFSASGGNTWTSSRSDPSSVWLHRRLLAETNTSAQGSLSSSALETDASNITLALPPPKPKKKFKRRRQPPFPPRPAYVHKGKESLFFTCPDGRKGLHLVHTRLMLNMNEARGAKGTFRASRMLLFRDFSLASMARQSAQNFVFYVSYDHGQDFPFLESCHDILKLRMTHGASFMYLPERGFQYTTKAHHMIAFPRVKELLIQYNMSTAEELDQVQLYVTSRIDSDDAANRDAVLMTQMEACQNISPELDRRILLTYFEPKLFWLPDPNTPYGRLATVPTDLDEEMYKRQKRAMRFRPVMQSLTTDASLFNCSMPVNTYSHYHYQPSFIVFSRNDTDCPFGYGWTNNVKVIKPAENAIGGLYTRTPGSWYAEINNRGYKFLNFNKDALKNCGIVPGEISSTNIMLGWLYEEAREAASLSADAVGGFGGIGVLSTWRKTKERLLKEIEPFRKAYYDMPTEKLQFKYSGLIESYLYGERWVHGQVVDYEKIAEEVLANATLLEEESGEPPAVGGEGENNIFE